MLRVDPEFLDSFAQHVLVDVQVAGGLRYRHALILNQLYLAIRA